MFTTERFHLSPEQEIKKTAWAAETKKFIYEHNLWAINAPVEEDPKIPDQFYLRYPPKGTEKPGDKVIEDRFDGTFMAPGMSRVFEVNKDGLLVAVWQLQYAGPGMLGQELFPIAIPSYGFLQEALRNTNPDLPIRGPENYKRDDYEYQFQLLRGDFFDCLWREKLLKGGQEIYIQEGTAGMYIHGKKIGEGLYAPVYPWDIE